MSRLVYHRRLISRLGRHLCLLAGIVALTATAGSVEKAVPAFGDAVKLTPFVIHGRQYSVSIHARTNSDRRYAEKFAEEVVEIAGETLGKSTGKGLVVVGREGEPHPVVVLQKFLSMAAAGQLDPLVAAKVGDVTALTDKLKTKLHLDEAGGEGPKLSFDLVVPALPLPLEGLVSKLYQLSWAEGFDDVRIEQRLRSLTMAELGSDALSKYDWVFYLPPRDAFDPVFNEVIKQAMKQQKFGIVKRAAVRSALVVFKPAIRTAIEAMRKGILFMTILRAESSYSEDDVWALTGAYIRVMMPDFKFNGGTEHLRALESIETQKVKNAEYAKDPYVSPARLATFDPATYAACEGEYTTGKESENAKGKGKRKDKGKEKEISVWTFKRQDETYAWQYMDQKPLVLYPAGERLFVSGDGKLTMQFKVDEQGTVTGVEERRVRHRRTFPRKL